MSRTVLFVTGVTALVVVAGGAAVWLLGGDAEPTPGPIDTAQQEAPIQDAPLRVEPNPIHPSMPGVFPWKDFQSEFDELMRPVPPPTDATHQSPDAVTANTLAKKKLTIRLEQATVNEIVEEIARQTEDTGIKVYTREPFFSDTMRYDVYQSDKNIWQVLAYLGDVSERLIKSYLGDGEVCIGTTLATMRAREDGKRKAARKRTAKEAKSELLDATFRPDFDGADAEKVARAMTAQTEIQVVMHPLVWEKHLAFTWRAKEMSLRKALDYFTKDLDAFYRVHEGRVFVLPIP